MLTIWEYSTLTDADRLVQIAHQIAIGFYKTNGFVVLPFLTGTSNTVVFPDLSYNSVSRFWEQSKKVNVVNIPLVVNQKFLGDVANLVQNSRIRAPDYEKTKEVWTKAESDIIDEIYQILPVKKNIIKRITIYPTSIGTNCSFNFINPQGEIYIYLRDDQGIHTITEAIVTSLTRSDIYDKLSGLWSESELVTDFLITQTSLSTILKKYENSNQYLPTIKSTRGKEQAKLLQESDNFYQKLGIPNFHKPFSQSQSTPKLFDKPIENLTDAEKKLAVVLIKNENQITDFDTLGSAIFKSDDNFSLYAISKTIQRLRDKFEANGISGSYIQTLRGKGYILKN